jgi:hypothetical protein
MDGATIITSARKAATDGKAGERKRDGGYPAICMLHQGRHCSCWSVPRDCLGGHVEDLELCSG